MEINVKFKHDYKDFKRTQLIYLFRLRKRYIILLPFILLVLFGILYLWISEGYSEYMMTAFILYGLSLFIIIYKSFVLPLLSFKRNPRARLEYSYTFNHDGMEMIIEDASSKYKWSFFQNVIETKDNFLFFFKKNLFIIIPKRVFNSDVEIEKLKEVLNEAQVYIKFL